MGNDLDLVAAMTNAHLSPFDGKPVVRAAVALFGTDGLSEAMAVNPMEIPQGTEGVCVVRWKCEEVKHKKVSKDTPDLLTRNHRLKVLTIAFADDKTITRLLDEQDERIREAKEKAKGIERLKSDDGADPIAEAEKVAKEARRVARAAAKLAGGDAGVVQSGTFKGEPFDPAKESARATRTRTPAARKAPVDEAVAAAEKIRTAKEVVGEIEGSNVSSLDDARKAAGGSDG